MIFIFIFIFILIYIFIFILIFIFMFIFIFIFIFIFLFSFIFIFIFIWLICGPHLCVFILQHPVYIHCHCSSHGIMRCHCHAAAWCAYCGLHRWDANAMHTDIHTAPSGLSVSPIYVSLDYGMITSPHSSCHVRMGSQCHAAPGGAC